MKKAIVILLWLFLLGYGIWNFGNYRYHQGIQDATVINENVRAAVEMQNQYMTYLENEIKKARSKIKSKKRGI